MILRLLEDKNGEVQNLAVRCLAPLVHKIKIQQVLICFCFFFNKKYFLFLS